MPNKQWNKPPAMSIDPKKTYLVNMQTNKGLIQLELYPQHAPKTVNNFVFLAKEGFYDGVTFHRVISNFVIQGGDPTGSGSGGPGYRFEDETQGNPLRHETGMISMANAGPNTNGSQFFVMHQDYPLTPNYVIFARVTGSMAAVDAIAETQTTLGADGGMSKPVAPQTMKKVTIRP